MLRDSGCLVDLLPHLSGVAERIHRSDDRVVIEVRSAASDAACPGCGELSGRVHGRYRRHLADTPLAGQPVVLRLTVRRFVCQAPGCRRRTFAEQIDGLTTPHARSSPRCAPP